MSRSLRFYCTDGKWLTDVEGTPKRVTFQLALGFIELDSVEVPYNDRLGDDKEYELYYRLTIDDRDYVIEVHENFRWRDNKRLDTSIIWNIKLDKESIEELVIPYDHPAMSCFNVVGDNGEC